MSDVATALLQLIGRTEPAADPALAAVKLARASLDALILRLGQSIDAKVTAQLAGGLTQLTAGSESFVLKLETALPVNTVVTLKISPTPTGQPAVTVTVQPQPAVAQPAPPAPQALSPLPPPPAASTAPPAPAPAAAQPAPLAPPPPGAAPVAAMPAPLSPTAPAAPTPAQVQPSITATQLPATPGPQAGPAAPSPLPRVTEAAAAMVPTAPTQTLPSAPAPAMSAPQPAPAPAAPAQPAPTAIPPLNQPTTPAAVSTPPAPAAASAQPATAQPPLSAPAVPASNSPTTSSPTPPPVLQPAATTLSAPGVASGPAPVSAPQPVSTPAVPSLVPHATTPATSLAPPTVVPPMVASPISTPRPVSQPASPPLTQILADPVQAAARQDSVLPLIARLATLAAPTAAALPRPALEAIAMLLGTRLDLNRAPPDGKMLRDAVLRTGIITEPGTRTPTDAKSALLQLRSALSGFLGGEVEAIAPVTRRPPPPLKGEPVRAPSAPPAPPLAEESVETARQLLGHADAALSRVKLLQLASNPNDAARPNVAAPAAELRVEVPMQLGAETGILQLLVERDGRHKRTPAERGWRMRFALNFAATGEVGAEVALLGRSASVSLWAADPATADALEAMLTELAPALARHGLDLGSIRVRRGAPQPAVRAPGQLLDSAR